MIDFGKSRIGTGEGSGRRRRGADGPGVGGGMFAGSEGPERAVAGRYERRQTRQVLRALFWLFFGTCTVAPMWQQRIGGDRRCGRAATCPFLDPGGSEGSPLGAATGVLDHPFDEAHAASAVVHVRVFMVGSAGADGVGHVAVDVGEGTEKPLRGAAEQGPGRISLPCRWRWPRGTRSSGPAAACRPDCAPSDRCRGPRMPGTSATRACRT